MRTTTLVSITLASCLAACAPPQDVGASDPTSDNAALGVAPAATVAYVQNRTTLQTNASFDVDGTGAVGKSLRVGALADAGAFVVANDAAVGSPLVTAPNSCVLDMNQNGEARLALRSDALPQITMQAGDGGVVQIAATPDMLTIAAPFLFVNDPMQVNGSLVVNQDLAANSTLFVSKTLTAGGDVNVAGELTAGGALHARATTYTVGANQLGQGICAQPFGAGYPIVDCTCPAGTYVLNGGADAGGGNGRFIRESRQTTASTWRVTCVGGTVDVLCQTYSLTCSAIAP